MEMKESRQLLHHIRQLGLIAPEDSVLLAVSGGLDSMVLLDLMMVLRPVLSITLAVAHLNHGLRPEAWQEEAFVARKCVDYGLRFFSVFRDVPQLKCQGQSMEEAARLIRYDCLNALCRKTGMNKLATAHHGDDQAETILMNLIRGSGIRGLRGIQPQRQHLIRPLLGFSRADLARYASKRSLEFVHDDSNDDCTFLRNRIRHNHLARLKQDFGEGVVQRINRAGRALHEIEAFLNDVTEKARKDCIVRQNNDEIVLDIHRFLYYFTAIQKNVLFSLLDEFIKTQFRVQITDIQHILTLAKSGKSGGQLRLTPDVSVYKTSGHLAFARTKAAKKRIHLLNQGITACESWPFDVKIKVNPWKGEQEFPASRFIEKIDFDQVKGPLNLRTFKPGDAFVPLGMKGKKKIQDFFVDAHVPVYQRKEIPLIEDENGIVWVVGYRIDHRYRIQSSTKKVMTLEMIRKEKSL